MEVLGCEMVQNKARQMTTKEVKKLGAAEKMMKTVASLPIGYKLKTTAIKMLGLSEATYGRVARGIEGKRTKKNFGTVLEAIGATWARRANRGLKAAMIGGALHLKIITLQRQVNIIQTMLWRSEET